MKKLIAILLSIAMVMSLMVTTIVAADTSDLTVSGIENGAVEYGAVITAVFTLKKPTSGITAANIRVLFNNEVLEATSIATTGDTTSFAIAMTSTVADANNNGFYSFGGTAFTAFQPTQDFTLTAVFTVKSNVEESEYADLIKVDTDATYYGVSGSDPIIPTFGNVSVDANITAPPVPVTGVSVEDLSLNVGETKTLSWSVTPENATNKDVTFLNNDLDVVELNATTGEVKGLKEGTATVTVTTVDGSFYDTCIVTVSCGHTAKTDIAEKASTCKEKGWDAYKKCADCEQRFDAFGNKIDAIPYRALSTEHTEGTPANCVNQAVCSVCGEAYGEPTGVHNFTKENAVPERLASPATCQNPAKYYYSCAVCGVS